MSKYCPYRDGKVTYQQCSECETKICSEDTFFCLVIGSRSFQNYSQLKSKLDYLLKRQNKVVIVSGGARGADSLAERYAKEKNYVCLVYPANWEKFGRKAGYIRNAEMHAFIARQQKRGVVAFWDGKSPGTKQSIQLAQQYNNPIRWIIVKEGDNT